MVADILVACILCHSVSNATVPIAERREAVLKVCGGKIIRFSRSISFFNCNDNFNRIHDRIFWKTYAQQMPLLACWCARVDLAALARVCESVTQSRKRVPASKSAGDSIMMMWCLSLFAIVRDNVLIRYRPVPSIFPSIISLHLCMHAYIHPSTRLSAGLRDVVMIRQSPVPAFRVTSKRVYATY